MFEPKTYAEFDELLGRRESRKLAKHTYAMCEVRVARPGYIRDRIIVRLHDTNILIFESKGTVHVNTDHWFTDVTRRRIETYSPLQVFGKTTKDGQKIQVQGGDWMIYYPWTGESWPYEPYLTVDISDFRRVQRYYISVLNEDQLRKLYLQRAKICDQLSVDHESVAPEQIALAELELAEVQHEISRRSKPLTVDRTAGLHLPENTDIRNDFWQAQARQHPSDTLRHQIQQWINEHDKR